MKYGGIYGGIIRDGECYWLRRDGEEWTIGRYRSSLAGWQILGYDGIVSVWDLSEVGVVGLSEMIEMPRAQSEPASGAQCSSAALSHQVTVNAVDAKSFLDLAGKIGATLQAKAAWKPELPTHLL